MNKREILETWFQRVWRDEDLDAIAEMMVEDAPVHGLDKSPQLGAADFRAFAETMLKRIKETTITIDEYIESGDQVSVLMNISAKCRKTGKPVQIFGLTMCRIVDGKIARAYNYADFIGLFEQLGTMPPDVMKKCLCGEPLGTT